MKKMILSLLLVPVFGYSQEQSTETVKEVVKSAATASIGKTKRGRIEKIKDVNGTVKSIRLMSSDGKVKKELPVEYYWHAKMSDNDRLLYVPRNYFEEDVIEELNQKGHLTYPVKIYDEEGNVKLDREFKVYPKYPDVEGVDEFSYDISKDGSRAYVNYANDKSSYTLIVYDITSGKEVLRLDYDFLLSQIEISPDGKIVGGETNKEGDAWKYFYFIEVDSGKTKLVKVSGEDWKSEVIFFSKYYKEGKIRILYLKDGVNFSKYVSFSELPEDLSLLLEK